MDERFYEKILSIPVTKSIKEIEANKQSIEPYKHSAF